MHDHSITTCVLECTDRSLAVDLERLKRWLADVLWGDFSASAAAAAVAKAVTGKGETKAASSGDSKSSDAKSSEPECQIFRMKALMHVRGEQRQFFLQGVQELFDIQPGEEWPKDAARMTRFVVIGESVVAFKGFSRLLMLSLRGVPQAAISTSRSCNADWISAW